MNGRLPLYVVDVPSTFQADMNAGLWYDKFCNEWQPDWSGLGDEGKKKWINTVTAIEIGNSTLLTETLERREQLLKATNGFPLFFRTTGPFVTGLGREHPVENGFAWNHTLGIPYLPGSSIKGMVRNWAEQWDEGTGPDDVTRIFGPRAGKDTDASVGSVIFMDALPTRPVQLKTDVMTPHYGPYYQDESGREPPADWHNPTPVPFLVVEEKQEFMFGIIPRDPASEDCVNDCETVKGWLLDALCYIGAGAKTAVGYGRFKYEKDESPALKWLNDIAMEQEKSFENISVDLPGVLLQRLSALNDDDLKKEVSQEIKNQLLEKGLYEGKPWGQLKKLISLIKQNLGE